MLTSPFVPLLFQGEEWAASSPFQFFASFEDPALARAVREGRQREFAAFGWKPQDVPDPQSPATFERSRLNWQEIAAEPHASMLRWYRELVRLRRPCRDFSGGLMESVPARFDEQAQWLCLHRGQTTVACNFAGHAQTLPLEPGGSASILLTSRPGVRLQQAALELPLDSVVILGPART